MFQVINSCNGRYFKWILYEFETEKQSAKLGASIITIEY